MSEGTLAATVRELRPAAEPRSLVEHSLLQLTLVRFREFLREPEAVFWVFVFPILLAAILGLAFRSKPPEPLPVGVVAGTHADVRLAALAASSDLKPTILSESEAPLAL